MGQRIGQHLRFCRRAVIKHTEQYFADAIMMILVDILHASCEPCAEHGSMDCCQIGEMRWQYAFAHLGAQLCEASPGAFYRLDGFGFSLGPVMSVA